MELISYIIWVIIAPLIFAFLGLKIFKKRIWIIIGIETFIVLLLTFVGIIENNPTGNMQRQLSSYFGNITNSFYLKYIPFLIVTILFIQFFKKTKHS